MSSTIQQYTGLLVAVFLFMSPVHADTLTLDQVLQRVVDNYLPLKNAELQIERSVLEKDKVEGQFGWNIGSKIGITHDVGFLGTPSNKLDANVNADRLLPSGDRVGVVGAYAFEDADLALSPLLPNPSHTTRMDLSYRRPLWKGAGNPNYAQGLVSAEATKLLASANKQVLRDQLAAQIIDLYFSMINTQDRIANLEESAERTKRLLKYIKGNFELGLTEDKDVLQIEAQIQSQLADREALHVALSQQQTQLNRLMSRDWSTDVRTVMGSVVKSDAAESASLVDNAIKYSPQIKIQEARIKIAEAAATLNREARKNTLDAIVSVGTRTSNGDNNLGASISEQDVAGAISVEYRRSMDNRTVDAQIQQAEMDKTLALEEIRNIQQDTHYRIAGLLAEIQKTDMAINAYSDRLERERKKYEEAEKRYRNGRADTQQLILFENDMKIAGLLVKQQKVELVKRQMQLALAHGGLWRGIVPLQAGNEVTP